MVWRITCPRCVARARSLQSVYGGGQLSTVAKFGRNVVDNVERLMQNLTQFRGPVLVTVVYFVMWYSFLFGLQTRTKYRLKARYEQEGKVFDRYFGQDPEMLAADRAVANTLEQMGPFLVSLWLFACFVSTTYATTLGAIYIALRSVYPFLLGQRLSKVQSKRVAMVTFPCYIIVFTMLGGSAYTVLVN